MAYRIGFIGCGNMASAILLGAARAGFLRPETTYVYDVLPEKARELARGSGAQCADSLQDLAERADILLMAVKPDVVEAVVDALRRKLPGKAILSIAAGWPFARYRDILPEGARVCFVMPNTPCQVGEGMALIEEENSLTPPELDYARGLFGSIGKVEMMKPALMDAAGSLSGCGPAFCYLFIEALADGAVLHGVPREAAYRLAGQMVVGAGRMVLESGRHPGALKDSVCSPGGTTIRGVRALEEGGMRAALIDALDRTQRPR